MENENLNRDVAMPMPMAEMEQPLLKEGWRPSNREILKSYQINIEFLDRGCIVRVGCKSIAFESVEKAMEEINSYVANPYEKDKEWRKILDV